VLASAPGMLFGKLADDAHCILSTMSNILTPVSIVLATFTSCVQAVLAISRW
jgi:hypothetical protein